MKKLEKVGNNLNAGAISRDTRINLVLQDYQQLVTQYKDEKEYQQLMEAEAAERVSFL